MVNKVRLDKGHLDYFRKLARQSPLEIQAYLIGEVVSPTLTVIDSFEYTQKYGTQTETEVAWFTSEYERVARKAEERGKRIVGDIHTHPGAECLLSEDDYKAAISIGTRVSGICSIFSGKTSVRFWVMDCALPCEIVYAKKKARQ